MQPGLADAVGLTAGTIVTTRGVYGVGQATKRGRSSGEGGLPLEPVSSGCQAA